MIQARGEVPPPFPLHHRKSQLFNDASKGRGFPSLSPYIGFSMMVGGRGSAKSRLLKHRCRPSVLYPIYISHGISWGILPDPSNLIPTTSVCGFSFSLALFHPPPAPSSGSLCPLCPHLSSLCQHMHLCQRFPLSYRAQAKLQKCCGQI